MDGGKDDDDDKEDEDRNGNVRDDENDDYQHDDIYLFHNGTKLHDRTGNVQAGPVDAARNAECGYDGVAFNIVEIRCVSTAYVIVSLCTCARFEIIIILTSMASVYPGKTIDDSYF